jgi:TonB family protein
MPSWSYFSMKVRQAFYISIAAHILIFGGAIAVAHYGRGLFLSSGDTMMVALVSPGQTSGSGSGPVAGHARAAAQMPNHVQSTKSKKLSGTITNQADAVKNEKSLEPTRTQFNSAKNEMPAEMHTEPDRTPTQQPGQITENAAADGNDTGPVPYATAGQGASAQFGVVAPPEWAILAAAIERTKNYPRLARERGIEGVVRLRFKLTSFGSVEKLEILQSSGSEVLDNASINAVYRAAPLPYMNGWIEIPMKYMLK